MGQPLRVTFVLASADLSGGVRVIATYARLLAERGHRVTVVSTRTPAWSLRRRLGAALRGRGLPPRGVSHLDGVDGIERRVVDQAPIGAADVPDADVVVATWWQTAEWVAQLPASKGAKLHLVQGHELAGDETDARVRAVYRLPLRRVAVSRWLVDVLRAEGSGADVALVPNGVDPTQFHGQPRGKAAAPTVGVVTSAIPCKRTGDALRAIEHLRRRLPELRVVAFGDARAAQGLRPGELHTHPPQSELAGLYARCDAWLVSSEREGFALPILEAMACRTPVVSTRVGAAPELLASGGGRLVAVGDVSAMSEALLAICQLPDAEWRSLSDVAYAESRRHSWSDATDRFEAVLVSAVVRAPRDSSAG